MCHTLYLCCKLDRFDSSKFMTYFSLLINLLYESIKDLSDWLISRCIAETIHLECFGKKNSPRKVKTTRFVTEMHGTCSSPDRPYSFFKWFASPPYLLSHTLRSRLGTEIQIPPNRWNTRGGRELSILRIKLRIVLLISWWLPCTHASSRMLNIYLIRRRYTSGSHMTHGFIYYC
jgi:hypothetical protein